MVSIFRGVKNYLLSIYSYILAYIKKEDINKIETKMDSFNHKDSRKFRMTVLNWIEGVLAAEQYFFLTLFDAKKYCEVIEKGKIKIYDHEGHVCHSEEKHHHHHGGHHHYA